MYGILLESIVAFIKKSYSEEKWQLIRKTARIDHDTFSAHQVYAETLIPRIVDACHAHLGLSKDEILLAFGKAFVDYVSHYGYDKILKVVGRNFRDFLNGSYTFAIEHDMYEAKITHQMHYIMLYLARSRLDNIHEYLRFSYPKLKPPSFFCEQESRSGLILHYRSRRRYDGYTGYVVGQLKAVGRSFYKQDISVSVLKQETIGNMVHVTFQLNFDNSAYVDKAIDAGKENMANLPLRMDVFYDLFPFHILFDREMIIRSTGKSLRATVDEISGYDVTQVFSLKKPLVDFSWDSIMSRTNTMFELSTIDPIRGKEQDDEETYIWTDDSGKKRSSSVVTQDDDNGTFLRLKGQMLFVKEWESMLFLGTAILQDLDVLSSTGLYLNDLSMHDNSRDLVLAGAQQGVEMKLILKQESMRTKQLEDATRRLEKEKSRSQALMYKLLPKTLATEAFNRLEANETELGLANESLEVAPHVTLMLCCLDVADDSPEMARRIVAIHKHLELFSERFGYFKIETTQATFMAVSGIPTGTETTEENACFLAKKIVRFASNAPTPLPIYVAIHGGPTTYSVIGSRFPRLCVFGPTVTDLQALAKLAKSVMPPPNGANPQMILLTDIVKMRLPKESENKMSAGPTMNTKKTAIKTYILQTATTKDG